MNRAAFVKAFQSKLAAHPHFTHGFQSWWHNYIFHFSDITNIVKILNLGKLYSRNKAIELGLMSNDNADDEVIAYTGLNAKDYARFYFGAKTPTQYNNEGFKSERTIRNNAHCPLPIFLLFDFVKLLSREDCLFSDGNIASRHTSVYEDITALNNLEFNCIYHRAPLLDEETKSHIKNCRHAEVLIPHEINVYDYLIGVCVRSEAEKQTLLYNLSQEAIGKLKDRIVLQTNGLFNADRLYVEKVYTEANLLKILFSKATTERYNFTVILKNLDTGYTTTNDTGEISLENRLVSIALKPEFIGYELELQLYINGNLAYNYSFKGNSNIVI